MNKQLLMLNLTGGTHNLADVAPGNVAKETDVIVYMWGRCVTETK